LTVHIAHLLSYYLLIQLYLPLVKIGNLYLNLGWMRYVIMHRHKYFCYYLFDVKKRDLPKRTGPFYLYQSDIYSSTAACAAARRAIGTRKGEQLA